MKLSVLEPFESRYRALPARRRKLLRRAGWALLIYSILGFIVLPLIVRPVATRRLARELDREVSIKSVRINPYAFSCAVRGLMIKDHDGEPFVSWDKVYVNFELASFLGRPWVFREVSATNIYLRAQMNKDRTFNFSDLIEKFGRESGPPKPSKPLALRVRKLSIRGTRAAVTDLTPRRPFTRVIGPLDITLNRFYTDPTSRNPHSFTGSTDSGELFSWSGQFSLNPIRAEGDLSVANVALNKYSALYQDLLRFDIQDGVASFRGSYKFVSGATNIVQFTNVSIALDSFKLAEPNAVESLVNLPQFAVSGVSGDLVSRRVDVGSLAVTGAVLNLHRSHDASVNVVEMAKPAATATNTPGGIVFLLQTVTNLFSVLFTSTNVATATLRDLSVENCAVSFKDEVNSRPVSLNLDQIRVAAKNLSNLPGTNLTADVSLRWNTNGTIQTSLTASLVPLSADMHLLLDQIELRPLDPYLEPFVYLFIIDSKLGLDGQIRLRAEPGQLPAVTFNGSYHLDDFAAVDGAMAEDLVKWKSLRFDGIEAKLNPPEVSIARVELIDAFARVAVETNGTINLTTALRPANTNQAAVTPPPAEPPAGSGRKALSQVKEVMSRTNEVGVAGLPRLSVASVVVSNAHLQLSDRSLMPRVEASVEEINGTITDISSDELRHARLHLEGKVGRTGPVEINGQFNPLHQDAATTVKVSMKDVDLNPSDPYMEKFLGYRLRKGKLNVEVSYEMTARKLKGQNLIQLDQFTLGEKVNSPDATKLPVKLGVALLKDRAGNIELDVPVEGILDDPQFKLGRVIGHTIVNVFTKIVTSPFSVLGSLFGGKGEETGYQDFEPGSSELLPASKEKLDGVVKGLYERPGLEVEIEGNVDPVADRDGLRRAKLEQQLRVRKWTTLRRSEQSAVSPQQIILKPEERERYLGELHRKTFGQSGAADSAPGGKESAPVLPSASGPQQKGAELLAQRQFTPEERQKMVSSTELRLLESIPITEQDLRTLADDRARQVQNYLVQIAKVEAERVYLTQDSPATGTNGHRVYLHLR